MSILTEVFQSCYLKYPQCITGANSSAGCVLGGKFSLVTPLPRIDITQILPITNISSETVSLTAKRFIAFSPLRLAYVQKHLYVNKEDEKSFFFYSKYTLQKCPIFIKIKILIFQEEEIVDTRHSSKQGVLKTSEILANTNKTTWHNTRAVNELSLKDLLILPSL